MRSIAGLSSGGVSVYFTMSISLHMCVAGSGLRCGDSGRLEVAGRSNRAGCYRNMGMGRGTRREQGGLVVRVRATQERDMGSKRLVDVVRRLPRIGKAYFRDPFRRALFGGIAILGGFYVAQTISLSFGALGVNDVIAAAMCVLFTEYVTRFTRTRNKITFPVALVNNFKMGFTYGLFIDAFKLAS